MAAICVDVGTTVVKAVGYDADGVERVVARRVTPVSRPRDGWAEQDMATVWVAVCETVREVAAVVEGPVRFLATTAQGDGLWLVDADSRPTGPAVLWNDGRATGLLEGWRERGLLEKAFRINGTLGFAGLPHALLRWLVVHDTERLARSAAALTCGGWIFSELTGRQVMEISDASAPFLDLRTRMVSKPLLRMFDLEWAEQLLREPVTVDQQVAPLTERAAGQLGLPAGLPIVLAPYDVASSALGVGAVTVGQACCILGTTLSTEVVVEAPDLDSEPSGLTVALGPTGHWLRVLPTLAGVEVIDWAVRLLSLSGPEELTDLAAESPLGAAGLMFLPYLSPAGERAPFLDPSARGSMLGLGLAHGREHVARAVIEGLTFVIRDCLRAMPRQPTELRICGGGARNRRWAQLIADVTGLPVVRTVDAEAGARGAYVTGCVLTGQSASVDDAARRHVRTQDTFEPGLDAVAAYDRLFDRFLVVRETVLSIGVLPPAGVSATASPGPVS